MKARKQAAAQPAERVCAVCGARGPAEGPLGWSWDIHRLFIGSGDEWAKTRLVFSCSAACRAERGWLERKGGGRNG